MKKGTPPTRTTAFVPFTKPCDRIRCLGEAVMIVRPCAASWKPSGVACSGRRPLRKSGSPTRASSMADDRLTAGWVRPSKAAPSETPPASSTAGELHQVALVQLHSKMLYKRPHNSSSIAPGRAIPSASRDGRPRRNGRPSATRPQGDELGTSSAQARNFSRRRRRRSVSPERWRAAVDGVRTRSSRSCDLRARNSRRAHRFSDRGRPCQR